MQKREKAFRKYFNTIFDLKNYDQKKLLSILSRFEIDCFKRQIDGICYAFNAFLGHIPESNRDHYIAALVMGTLKVVLITVEQLLRNFLLL